MSSHDLCTEFVKVIQELIDRGFLAREVLQDYNKAKHGLHGLLESAFVEAGWRINMVPIVEPRIDLLEPFDPASLDGNFAKKKKRHQYRPDISFKCNNSMYFAECCTTDNSFEYLSSEETLDDGKGGWITKRDLLLHFVEHAKPDSDPALSGLIICITLPRQMKQKPPWLFYKNVGIDFLDRFRPDWKRLADDLGRILPTDLIILEEENVHVNNTPHPIRMP